MNTSWARMAQPSQARPGGTSGRPAKKIKIGPNLAHHKKIQVLSRLENAQFYLCKAVNSVKFSQKSKKVNEIDKNLIWA